MAASQRRGGDEADLARLRNVEKRRWNNPPIAWQAAKAQLAIQFEERFLLAEWFTKPGSHTESLTSPNLDDRQARRPHDVHRAPITSRHSIREIDPELLA